MEAFNVFLADPAVKAHLLSFVLGSVRILTFLSFAPFMGPQLTMAVKIPLLLAFYLPLHPLLLQMSSGMALPWEDDGQLWKLILLLGKEVLLGFVLAYMASLIFYAVLSAGIIIDNQRGASQAQAAEPFAGAEATPLGVILMTAMVTLFFTSGAFMNFLTVFYSTYIFWPPTTLLPGLFNDDLPRYFIANLDFLLLQALLLCAPFVLVALMCDIALGLINRFAPQLNVFILSMPIKSGACALLILFYLGPFMNYLPELFALMDERILLLRRLSGAGA